MCWWRVEERRERDVVLDDVISVEEEFKEEAQHWCARERRSVERRSV